MEWVGRASAPTHGARPRALVGLAIGRWVLINVSPRHVMRLEEVLPHVDGEVIRLGARVRTVREAAAALGVPETAIVKTLVVMCGGRPLAFIVRGDKRLDLAAVSRALGCEARLASPSEVVEATGYPVGGVPPVVPLETYIDRDVLALDVAYGGGGDERSLVRFSPGKLASLVGARPLDV